MKVFENEGSASLCGRVKTEVFENDYVTGSGMSQLKKQNGCFFSVDGRKRCKNASVDEKRFIRFQETENGGFRKRVSVDRAFKPEKSSGLNGIRTHDLCDTGAALYLSCEYNCDDHSLIHYFFRSSNI